MAAAQEYFKNINLSVLPDNISAYIKDEIINNPRFEVVDINDENFIRTKELLETKYPDITKLHVVSGQGDDKAARLELRIKAFKIILRTKKGEDKKKIELRIKAFEILLRNAKK